MRKQIALIAILTLASTLHASASKVDLPEKPESKSLFEKMPIKTQAAAALSAFMAGATMPIILLPGLVFLTPIPLVILGCSYGMTYNSELTTKETLSSGLAGTAATIGGFLLGLEMNKIIRRR